MSKTGESATLAAVAAPPSNTEALLSFAEANTRAEIEQLVYPYPSTDERGDLRIQQIPIASVPKGRVLVSVKKLLDEYLPRPERIVGEATLRDEASFIAHVNELKQPTTRIFCEPEGSPPTFTAVYDYHAVTKNERQQPNWCAHRAEWPIAMSKEWQIWTKNAGRTMNATEFAEFLDVRVPDVYWGDERSDHMNLLIQTLQLRLASPTSLVALSRNLAVNVDVQVRHAQTLSSGEIAISYTEQHKDGEGEPIRVPNAFMIKIPVVQGGPLYVLLGRLRYRVLQGGKISWAYDLLRTTEAFEDAMKEITARVQDATGCTVFLGSPEA